MSEKILLDFLNSQGPRKQLEDLTAALQASEVSVAAADWAGG